MARVIWKYRISDMPSTYFIQMPVRSRVISTGIAISDEGAPAPHVWAEVTPEWPTEMVRIDVLWTGGSGEDVPLGARFVGTISMDGGYHVLHVYVTDPVGLK